MTTFNPMAPIKAGSWEKGKPCGQTRGQIGQHLSPVATIIKHHRQMAMKIHSHIWRPEVETKMWQGYTLSGFRAGFILPPPAPGGICNPWLVGASRQSVPQSLHAVLSPVCLCLSFFFL